VIVSDCIFYLKTRLEKSRARVALEPTKGKGNMDLLRRVRNPLASLPPAAQTVAAGVGLGLVAIGVQILLAEVGRAPASAPASPRLSPNAQSLIQIAVGLGGGALIEARTGRSRLAAAFAAANGAIGMAPWVNQQWAMKVSPRIRGNAATVRTNAASPAANAPALQAGQTQTSGAFVQRVPIVSARY
jgi:hypothetical protein